jgi:hypothetical protein
LSTVDFREKWREFCRSRVQIGHPLTEAACSGILRKLANFDPDVGVEALQNSINAGWRDVFPDKVKIGNLKAQGMGNIAFANEVFR